MYDDGLKEVEVKFFVTGWYDVPWYVGAALERLEYAPLVAGLNQLDVKFALLGAAIGAELPCFCRYEINSLSLAIWSLAFLSSAIRS